MIWIFEDWFEDENDDGDASRGWVEHVDEDQAEGHQQDDPGWHDVRGDEERHLNIQILTSTCQISSLLTFTI